MKNKKLLAAIVAVTMSATTAAAFSGCNTDKHKHDYTDWTVTTPATCTEEGVETGTCKADGAPDTRAIPALGHKYGDWQIVVPGADKTTGTATKICSNDSSNEHPLTVELPALGNSAYSVVKLGETPTYTTNRYTYNHTEGNIVFTVNVPKTDVTLSVAQAVETANDSVYTALAGKGEGSYKTYRPDMGGTWHEIDNSFL